MEITWLVAVVAGAVQGLLEWLPVSSEGHVGIALAAAGADPTAAIELALFLHLGTATAATAYYRAEIPPLAGHLPALATRRPFEGATRETAFLVAATAVSMLVGVVAYAGIQRVASAATGAGFTALVGLALIATGVLHRRTPSGHTDGADGERDTGTGHAVDGVDAVLVGALQGLAVIPGVSRSGVTVGGLLLRGVGGDEAFRLSFLLAVPASLAAAGLVVLEGLPGIGAGAAVAAVIASATVGYLAIAALLDIAERIDFGSLCLLLGALATVGGLLVL